MKRRPTVIIDEPPWWQRHRWGLAGLATLAALAGAAWWWAATTPGERDVAAAPPAAMQHAPVLVGRLFATPSVTVEPAEPPPAALQTAPAQVSTMVAPGVHITPLSVPPGTQPMPVGPSPDDSEAEN